MGSYRRMEDLVVYQRLCRLHIEVSELTHRWPPEEKYELGSQARRSSNSAPAQLAEKYDVRHVRNKIEGINRSRGEAAETVHHRFIAHLKGYESATTYEEYRALDTRSASGCSMAWNAPWSSSCRNRIAAGPNPPCGSRPRITALVLLASLTPEP